jgi:hypothetical protein
MDREGNSKGGEITVIPWRISEGLRKKQRKAILFFFFSLMKRSKNHPTT